MNNQNERTVFYVQQNQDGNLVDLYCLASQAEANKWIAKNNIEDTQILEVQSSTSHPEMVNKRFDNPSANVEPASAPQIKYEYLVQYQTPDMKAGWLDYKQYDNENDADDAVAEADLHGIGITRIKKVGINS